MAFHELDEIPWRVTGECRTAEMRILREKIFRSRVDIGEIAATAAGDTDFFAKLVVMLNQQHALAALTRFGCAHHARSTGTENDHVKSGFQRRAL